MDLFQNFVDIDRESLNSSSSGFLVRFGDFGCSSFFFSHLCNIQIIINLSLLYNLKPFVNRHLKIFNLIGPILSMQLQLMNQPDYKQKLNYDIQCLSNIIQTISFVKQIKQQKLFFSSISSPMIEKALHEINEMSAKIQQGVQRVLVETGKPLFLSPQTHHNSSNQIKHRKTGHQKSASEHIPTEYTHSHIRKFMVEEQNTLLHEQLEQQKQKGKQYREQIRQMKKYIKFLEQYNESLKKQVVLWMTRPAKKQPFFQFSNVDKRIKQYRIKLGEVINNSYHCENIQSLSPNNIKINPEVDMYPSINLANETIKNIKYKGKPTPSLQLQRKKGGFIQPSQYFSGSEEEQQNKGKKKLIRSQIFTKKRDERVKKKFSLNPQKIKKQMECTSCNYIKYKKQHSRSSNYCKIEQKDGCTKNKRGNKEKLKIERKNDKNGHCQSHYNHGNSSKKDINDLNISLDLKTYRNENLCDCHEKFMRNRKF